MQSSNLSQENIKELKDFNQSEKKYHTINLTQIEQREMSKGGCQDHPRAMGQLSLWQSAMTYSKQENYKSSCIKGSTCNSSTWKTEAEDQAVQGQPGL